MDDASTIRDRARAVRGGGSVLLGAPLERRIEWLVGAADRLAAKAEEARELLAADTGLSAPMVDWGVRTTLATVHEEALLALARDAADAGGAPLDWLPVILAGNLFTASIRAVFIPLLLGTPVLVKAASREASFPMMIERALRDSDPELGIAASVVVFKGGDAECEAALLESADAVSVYGGDETVNGIASRHPGVTVIPHGHGVSLAYCGADGLDDDHIEETIRDLALDICAYDQRGCLSPQIVFVCETPGLSAHRFAERLAIDGLDAIGRSLPRGPLPIDVGAAQAQWRGLAEVEGRLIVGDGFSIAVRRPAPIRWSPAYRNVTVAPVGGLREAVQAMELLGLMLKCVGVDDGSFADLRTAIEGSSGLSAYACSLGTMQTPALGAPADGKPVWHGLVR